jgi:ABC-type Mn2+/Zn2+ transport system ATPase subunit
MSAVIAFESATLGYGRKRVLIDVNLEVRAGEFLGIVGPNGSGKSTLLKAILGVVPPLEGRVWVRPADRAARSSGVAYVPQIDTVDLLYPLSALEVVLLGSQGRGGRLHPSAGREAVARARRSLAEVGLAGLEKRLFRSLSGGQRQRTLLARALACGADLLLLDEPTSGMDLAAEKAVMDLIAGLRAEGGRTVLFVTHQLNLVANYARTIAILKDGKLISGAAAEILEEGRLSSLYGVGVRVDQVGDRRVVVAL